MSASAQFRSPWWQRPAHMGKDAAQGRLKLVGDGNDNAAFIEFFTEGQAPIRDTGDVALKVHKDLDGVLHRHLVLYTTKLDGVTFADRLQIDYRKDLPYLELTTNTKGVANRATELMLAGVNGNVGVEAFSGTDAALLALYRTAKTKHFSLRFLADNQMGVFDGSTEVARFQTAGLDLLGKEFANVKVLTLDETTTPTPLADHGKVYTKNDNVLYFQDGAGVEHAASFPAGVIVMWHGTIANIPTGWVICDGNNGTPNLLAMFVQGVATAATNPGATGGATSKTTGGPSALDVAAYDAPTSPVASSAHTHTIADVRPLFYDVAFIMKT